MPSRDLPVCCGPCNAEVQPAGLPKVAAVDWAGLGARFEWGHDLLL